MGNCKSGCLTAHNQQNEYQVNYGSSKVLKLAHEDLDVNNEGERRKNELELDGGYKEIWGQELAELKKQVKRHCNQTGLIGWYVMQGVMSRFLKYRLTANQKRQFIGILTQFIELNYSPKRQPLHYSLQQCSKLTQHLSNLEQSILFSHKSALEHYKFLSGQHHQKKHYHLARFTQLQFNLGRKQIQNLSGIVRTFCEEDLQAFTLLTLYLRVAIEKHFGKLTFKDSEKVFQETLERLADEYKTQDLEQNFIETLKHKLEDFHFNRSKQNEPQQLIFNKYVGTNLQQVKEFKRKKHFEAQKDILKVLELMHLLKIPLKNTKKPYTFKLNNKLHNFSDIDSKAEIIEFLLDFAMDNDLQVLILETSANFRKQNLLKNEISIDTLNQLAQKQLDFISNKVQEYLKTQTFINFCPIPIILLNTDFDTFSNLIEATNQATKLLQELSYPISTIKNLLNQPEKTYQIVAKFPHSYISINFQLSQQAISKPFYSKINQLLKPKVFSPVTNLILLNKKWSEQFFTQLYMKIQAISRHTVSNYNAHKELRTSHDLGFEDLLDGLAKFVDKYLLSFGVDLMAVIKQKLKSQFLEISKDILKFKELSQKNSIKPVPKISYLSSNKNLIQKMHQIRFLLEMKETEKAEDILKTLKPAQLETMEEGLQITADFLVKKGFLKESIVVYKKCLKIQEKNNQFQSLSALRISQKLAGVYSLMKDYQLSIKTLEQGLKMIEKMPLKHSQIDLTSPLIKIGEQFLSLEDQKSALKYFNQALGLREKTFGQSSQEYAEILDHIGRTHQLRKRHQKALEFNKKCLEVYQKIYGRQSIHCADILSRLGASYLFKASYELSLDCYEKSLKIRQRIKGKDTLACVSSISSIGAVYLKCCEYNDALPFYKKCLSIVERTFGKNSIECVKELNNLIIVFYHLERYQEAILYGVRCLQIQESVKGKDSIDCSGTLFGLSIGYQKMSMAKEAEEMCKRAYEIRAKQLGDEHLLTVEVSQRLKDLQSIAVSIFC